MLLIKIKKVKKNINSNTVKLKKSFFTDFPCTQAFSLSEKNQIFRIIKRLFKGLLVVIAEYIQSTMTSYCFIFRLLFFVKSYFMYQGEHYTY